jgi:CRISPR/Cas system-associated exonuclease Cas4 (RecB family)
MLHKIIVATWTKRENETRISFRDGETQDGLMAQAIALIEHYLKEPPPENIVAIEQEIIAPLHNSQGEYLETPLVAVADLITEGNEELAVREFKTSSRAYSEMEAETSLQPTCYVNAVQEIYGHPATVEYTVLVKTKTPKVQRLTTVRTDEDLSRLGDIVETIERAIQAKVFYPVETPLNCSTCPFRQPCREWGRTENPELIQRNIKSAEARAC